MDSNHLKSLIDNWEIEKIIQLLDNGALQGVEAKIIASTALNLRGNYDRAINLAEEALKESSNLGDKKLEGMAREQIGTGLWWKGDTVLLKELITTSMKKLEAFKDEDPINAARWKSMLYIFQAWVYWKDGKLLQAEEIAIQLMDLYEKIGGQRLHAMAHYVRGVVYLYQGKLTSSIEVLQLSLEVAEAIENLPIIIYNKTTLGIAYHNKGELDISLQYFTEALYLYQELGNRHFICYTFDNIGVIYQIQGNFRTAEQYFSNAIELRRELGNDYELAQSLYNIIVNYLYDGAIDKAKTCLAELTTLSTRSDNKIIKLRQKLAEGLILKEQKRMVDKIKAQELLSEVINDHVFNIEITTHAMIALCELLLWELNITEEDDILEEIESLLLKLKERAEIQQSYTLLIEVLILQSKISILRIDIKKAKSLLDQAKILSEEMDLTHLQEKVEAEELQLFDKLNHWKSITDRNASFIEKISESEVIDYLRIVGNLNVRSHFPY